MADPIQLAQAAPMADYQRYIHALEDMHGWLDVDLVHNCFLLGEEVGELFKAIRRFEKYYEAQPSPGADATESTAQTPPSDDRRDEVAEELVDVFNYLLAIANRLNIDLEAAFRKKNEKNQSRSWT